LTYLVNLVPPDVLAQTTVHGEAPKLDAVREHLFAHLIFPVKPAFNFQTLGDSWPLPGGGTLSHFPLKHPGGSLGYRLDWPDRSMAYVTDTTAAPDAPYIERIRGVDLLLHEANFPDDVDSMPVITGHSWLQPVVEVAAAAGVGRLVLVHADPQVDTDGAFDLDAARRTFQNIEFGADRMELDF
jgi:ribonuclease BN (tRNA processing enzyme)